jgi:hypothetical protein
MLVQKQAFVCAPNSMLIPTHEEVSGPILYRSDKCTLLYWSLDLPFVSSLNCVNSLGENRDIAASNIEISRLEDKGALQTATAAAAYLTKSVSRKRCICLMEHGSHI